MYIYMRFWFLFAQKPFWSVCLCGWLGCTVAVFLIYWFWYILILIYVDIYEIFIFRPRNTFKVCVSGWLGCTVAVAVTASVGESIPADSLCGLPKWWRAAQPLLTPKLQGTKTTNKSKLEGGAGVGGGGLGVVPSLEGSTFPALLSLTKSARPGAAKSASAGPQGAPRRLPWRWWDIPSSLILQRTSVDLVSSFQPARKNDQWQCQNGPLPLSCQSPLLSQAPWTRRKVREKWHRRKLPQPAPQLDTQR